MPSPNDACPELDDADPYYNPVNDPLKITNLDNELLKPLQKTLSSIDIKHVALIMMESMRQDVFPLQQGSPFHGLLMKSHEPEDHDRANAMYSLVSPNFEKLTGQPGNFRKSSGAPFTPPAGPKWTERYDPALGGINILGGLTTASVSTKSVGVMHCGSWPLPVDMFEETRSTWYQPCFPQVLQLFNRMKPTSRGPDYRDQQWSLASFQSVTDGYDRQNVFNKMVGFQHTVSKHRIEKDARKNSIKLEKINYFGYPETVLRSYLRDYISNATADNQRMFISHFTSTTHHPWNTPKSFDFKKYMGPAGLGDKHRDMNKYLNAVHWTDEWLGELMQMFEDTGIANETLVIFVGDHGSAFLEDDKKTGTYQNGHITNFHVPITFRHPHIPRVQHTVNVTSVSIVPTILDLLISTKSLNAKDTAAASDILYDYEGQSLIRTYKKSHRGRRAWNFGLVNPGGRILTITSADTPWRLIMPLDGKTEYGFTDTGIDPLESERLVKWSVSGLAADVKKKYGPEAAKWVTEAEAVGTWWVMERKRLWQYSKAV
ncbi:hypothetical protein RJ55_04908 [Drechmeria coniospora]|nr:hypothetical protein RJ55_04908 [Drechmeria coniospora]